MTVPSYVDAELAGRLETAARAWEEWERSARGAADLARLAYWLSAAAARAQQLWSVSGYVPAFYDQAELAVDAWRAILNNPGAATAKTLSDAIIRTVIVERTRLALDSDWDEYWRKFFWINLQRANPPALLFALATGELTPQDLAEDVDRTIRKTEELTDKAKKAVKEGLWSLFEGALPFIGLVLVALALSGGRRR